MTFLWPWLQALFFRTQNWTNSEPDEAETSIMSLRQRLRTRGGCLTCKTRRKKCDEEKPICGTCRRLVLRCSWTPETQQQAAEDAGLNLTTRRYRMRSTTPKSMDLSAFRGQVCAAHVLETCFKATNLSLDPVHTERNGSTIQATLSFAPMHTSLAWTCIVALGLVFVGHRYQDENLVSASDLQHVQIVNKVRVAVEQGLDGINYDTLAAINLLGLLSVTRFWLGKSSRGDEALLHGIGLSAVLEVMRPEQFQSTHALALFEYLRFTVIMTALYTGRPTCLTSESWRTIPWAQANHTKGSMHALIDLLCELIPLQSEKKLTTIAPQHDQRPTAEATIDKVMNLLAQLHDWRRSIEPALQARLKPIDQAGESTLVHTAGGYPMQFERPNDLFQLGLFNMILIYLCHFLTPDSQSLPAARPLLQGVITSGATPDPRSILPTTPLALPIHDPIARATVAAKEIHVIWKCLASDGLFGCGSFYLSIPLAVAKIHLLREGDAEADELDEAINRIPAIWAGRR